MISRAEAAYNAVEQPMGEKEYREFDERLIAPINGITRDTDERAEADWESWAALTGKYGS